MRCLLRSLVGLCVLGSSAAVFGQAGALPNLTSRLVVVRFSMTMGRIEATADQPGFEREQTSTIEPGRHETLSVSTNNDQEATVKYDLTTEAEQLSFSVSEGYEVSFTRRPFKDSHTPQVEFRQPRVGPITLTVVKDGVTREVRGETVWYLLLAEPELCRQHLLPLLDMLRSDWRLVETAQAIESQMLRIAGAYQAENLRRWSSLVGDLASERFVVRQAAERELRAAGTVVIPYLQSLNTHQLDLEQSSRIRGIVDSQADAAEDTPEQAACRLMDDRSLWLVLAARPQESARRMAARQLAFLTGESIQFDPGAAESLRKTQLESLRKRIEAIAPAKSADDSE
jgi:hypothetical protein